MNFFLPVNLDCSKSNLYHNCDNKNVKKQALRSSCVLLREIWNCMELQASSWNCRQAHETHTSGSAKIYWSAYARALAQDGRVRIGASFFFCSLKKTQILIKYKRLLSKYSRVRAFTHSFQHTDEKKGVLNSYDVMERGVLLNLLAHPRKVTVDHVLVSPVFNYLM